MTQLKYRFYLRRRKLIRGNRFERLARNLQNSFSSVRKIARENGKRQAITWSCHSLFLMQSLYLILENVTEV